MSEPRPPPIRVLLVEDNPGDALLLREMLAEVAEQVAMSSASFEWTQASTLAQAISLLNAGGAVSGGGGAGPRFDVVLLDLSLPDSSGIDTFLRLDERISSDVAVILLTGMHDEELGYQAVQRGAQDYLVKGTLDGRVLIRSIRYAIERVRVQRVERALMAREDEFRVAREIQQKLFPQRAPEVPGFEIAGTSHPADATGGDYFDYVPLRDGSLGLIVGDVSSHGIGPALVMAETRAYLRALMLTRTEVGEIMTLANRAISHDTQDNCFVTLVLAALDPRARTLSFSSAGHPTCYVIDGDGSVRAELKSTDLPLGIEPLGEFHAEGPVQLRTGDTVLLLTDGVLEAAPTGGEPFGAERAIAIVSDHRGKPACAVVDKLVNAVHDYCQGGCRVDDITAMIVKVL